MAPVASIILSVKNRSALLRRCLQSYRKLSFKDYEIILVDDGSHEPIGSVVRDFSDLPIQYHRLESRKDRTPAVAWNYGIKNSSGDFVIVTGGDLILTKEDLLERFFEMYDGNRISVLTYFLSEKMTQQLDSIDWYNNYKLVEELPGFWDEDIIGGPNTTRKLAGLTSYMTGQTRKRWDWFGLFREDASHLMSDQDIYLRDMALGRDIYTLNDYYVLHQYHPTPNVTLGPGYFYKNKRQARLLEPALREDQIHNQAQPVKQVRIVSSKRRG